MKLLKTPPGEAAIPVGVFVEALEVDWTNARLRTRVVLGLDRGRDFPLPWNGVAGDALAIQLAEPVESEKAQAAWSLSPEAELPKAARTKPRAIRGDYALDTDPAPAASDGARGEGRAAPSQVRVGGLNPWFYAGGRAAADFDPVSPLSEGSARVNVLWLGRAEDWSASPPPIAIDPFLLLSTLDPATGRGQFILIVNRTDRPMKCDFISAWIASALSPDVWIAIHTSGEQSRAGVKEWRLGDSNGARSPVTLRNERAGAVLILEAAKPGDPVDQMRIGKVTLSASSSRNVNPPETIMSGRLWPSPTRPAVWQANPPTSGGSNPRDVESWLKIAPQSSIGEVDAIRIIFPSAVGWSAEFDPSDFEVDLQPMTDARFNEPVAIAKHGPVATIRFASPQRLRAVRLRMKGVARIAGVQLIGSLAGD